MEIGENHRRSISVALAQLDEVLARVESWLAGRHAEGVLYRETCDLTPPSAQQLRQGVAEIRSVLTEARDRLGLKPVETRASRDIWGRCAALRDTLSELSARHMKGYGALSPELAQYLDALSERLVGAVDRLAEAVRSPRKPRRA